MVYDVVIVGGGASGFMSGIVASRRGKSVIILEKKDRVLKKVLASGNGRCNYTNRSVEVTNYNGDDRGFTSFGLNEFGTREVVEFFSGLGIMEYVSESGRMYPMSLMSSSIVDSLRMEAARLGIVVITDFEVSGIDKVENGFIVQSFEQIDEVFKAEKKKGLYNKVKGESKNKSKAFGEKVKERKEIDYVYYNKIGINKAGSKLTVSGKKVILATGSLAYSGFGCDESGYEMAKKFGHKTGEITPALVQVRTEKDDVKSFIGLKVNGKITAYKKVGQEKIKLAESSGEILFADYGLSGNGIFELSYLADRTKGLLFSIDFMEFMEYGELLEYLKKKKEQLGHLECEHFLSGMINKKIGMNICKKAGIEKLNVKIGEIKEEEIEKIAYILKNYEIGILGTTGFKTAQVCVGGILTSDINEETMESKKVAGLYLTGEIVDIVGDCGGYNLHWAWVSGYLAGKNI